VDEAEEVKEEAGLRLMLGSGLTAAGGDLSDEDESLLPLLLLLLPSLAWLLL
jgi:hypothetical protein